MSAGILKQAGSAMTSQGAHPAKVTIRLVRCEKTIHMKTDLKVIPQTQVIRDLAGVLGGPERIRLSGRDPGNVVAPRKVRRYGRS